MSNKRKVVIICGPTSSGKTGVALQLAKELNEANVLSVDSRQVYQGLDIVTGKDTPKNLPKNIKIFGQGIISPDKVTNLAEFERYANEVIDSSINSNTPLIVVGGTGLYLKAITENLSDIIIPPNQKLRKTLDKLPLSKLQEKLKQVNPEKFSSLNRSDFMNPRRLIRAIEVSQSKDVRPEGGLKKQDVEYIWIGLMPDKDTLRKNIRDRVISRIDQGALEEVKALTKKISNHNSPLLSSLGLSRIIEFLNKKISLPELISLWTGDEVDYARRQVVWFKKQPGIIWYDKDTDKKKLVEELKKYYINVK